MRISYWSSDVCSSDLPLIGSVEYINGGERWILALQDAQPSEMRAPDVKSILEKVRLFREESSRPVTRELAKVPSSFAFTTIPNAPFLVIPEVSSERREYVPIGWLTPPTFPRNFVRATGRDEGRERVGPYSENM